MKQFTKALNIIGEYFHHISAFPSLSLEIKAGECEPEIRQTWWKFIGNMNYKEKTAWNPFVVVIKIFLETEKQTTEKFL